MGADWVRWRGYGPFFASLIRALQRQRSPAIALEVSPGPVRSTGRAISVAVEARDATGQYKNLQNPVVQVRQSGVDRGAGPRRHQAGGTRALRGDGHGRRDTAAQHQRRGADAHGRPRARPRAPSSRTRRLNTASGPRRDPAAIDRDRHGRCLSPNPASLANATGDSRTARRALWPPLIALALALWFVDLLIRRIRVFEPTVEYQG
jgi:hypothetical protein